MGKKILTPTGWKSLNESVEQTEAVSPWETFPVVGNVIRAKKEKEAMKKIKAQQKTEGLDLDGMLDYIFENHFEDVVLDYLDIVEASPEEFRKWLDAEKAAEKKKAKENLIYMLNDLEKNGLINSQTNDAILKYYYES